MTTGPETLNVVFRKLAEGRTEMRVTVHGDTKG